MRDWVIIPTVDVASPKLGGIAYPRSVDGTGGIAHPRSVSAVGGTHLCGFGQHQLERRKDGYGLAR
jgi:hypothetical protein